MFIKEKGCKKVFLKDFSLRKKRKKKPFFSGYDKKTGYEKKSLSFRDTKRVSPRLLSLVW